MVDDDIVALLPEATKDALGGALAALSLDVAGVDFALLDDGRALIFGFGAAMPVDAEESQVMDRIATLMEARAFGHRAGDGGES